jgi:hypothetical protein
MFIRKAGDFSNMCPSIKGIRQTRPFETGAGILILLLLAAIGMLIFFQQFNYDEKIIAPLIVQKGADVHTAGEKAEGLEPVTLVPEPFIPMSDREIFNRETLSDKINGKADAYLESEFVQLTARRFVTRDDPDLWFEFFAYDMAKPRNAFAVYSSQRRKDVTSLGVAKFSYATENAVFFAHGPYYVEMIAAQPDETLMQSMIVMSENFVAGLAADMFDLPELNYLPPEDLDIESVSIISKNGFGFEKFDNLFTGAYRIDGHFVTAFVSLRDTDEQAKDLADGYEQFLSDLIGGEMLEPRIGEVPGLVIIDVYGEYELFFSAGKVLAGIHAAGDPLTGETVAVKLYQRINGIQP